MKIFVHKSALMHSATRYASSGYHRYVQGEIHCDNIKMLLSKFEDKFLFNLSKDQKYRRKRRGLANSEFFVHPIHDEPRFQFFIMFTDGQLDGLETEKNIFSILKRRERLIFDKRFELIKLVAPGAQPRWTWRMSDTVFKSYKSEIEIAIRNSSDVRDLDRIVRAIYAMPGFRGIRQQTYGLLEFLRNDWGRVRVKSECPYNGKKLPGYLRLFKPRLVEIDDVIVRMKEGLTPFAHEWVYTQANEE